MKPIAFPSLWWRAGAGLVRMAPGLLLLEPLTAIDAAWSSAPTGGKFSDPNWTLGSNVPGGATGSVQAGDALFFGGSSVTTLDSDFPGPFAAITFLAGAPSYTIGGGGFTLSGNLTNLGGAQTIGSAIALGGNAVVSNATAAGILTLDGPVTGVGSVLTTSAGAPADTAAVTRFNGGVSVGGLISQGTAGNYQTGAPQAGGIYTGEQSTRFESGLLEVSGNVVVGRSNLVFTGSTVARIAGPITNAGAASADWASVVISGSADVTATDLNMAGTVATGQFHLGGGTLRVGSISGIDSTDATWSVRNVFNGTTVVATRNNAAFLTVTKSAFFAGGSTAYLGNDGAVIDTDGFDIGTAANLADDTSASGTLTKLGAGALTPSGTGTYSGVTSVEGGTLRVNGGLAGPGAVEIAGGARLGGRGTVGGPVSLAAGGTEALRGGIDLVDGAIGTLVLSHASGLALGGSTGEGVSLDFEVGGSGSDAISLGGNPLTVGEGGAVVTISDLGIEAGRTYELAAFGSAAGAGFATGTGPTVGGLVLANPQITFGVTGELRVTATSIELVTSGSNAPFTAYWSGVKGSSWTDSDAGGGNFTENPNGTGFVGAYPSSVTEVVFSANGNGAPANLSNSLGKDFVISGLRFANGSPPAEISGGHRLTLDGGGIRLEAGNGGARLAMDELHLAQVQSVTNDSAADLTIGADIGGTGGLDAGGSGTGIIVLSGSNSHTGGTFLSGGGLRLDGAGTLGSADGTLVVDAGVLDLNGTSQSVGVLLGAGGTILNGDGNLPSVLTVGNGGGTGTFDGVIADGAGEMALTKTGGGNLFLAGANSYSGKTTLNGGSLSALADGVLPPASVVEINNGAKLNLQGFAQSIGGLTSTAGTTNVVQNQENGGSGLSTLVIDTDGADFTFTGIIRDSFASTGALALVKSGEGTQVLRNTTALTGPGTVNDHTGGITINGGTLLLSDSGNSKVIGSLASDIAIADAGATLGLEVTLEGNTQELARRIGGAGSVVVTAGNLGTVALGGENDYTGSTVVDGGTLRIDRPFLSDSAEVRIAEGARLELGFTGTDRVGGLRIGNSEAAEGTWGAPGSGAQHIDGDYFSGAGVLLVGEPQPGYASWASVNAGGQGPDLDFDRDGVPNGIEFFMGETGSGFTANPGIVGGTLKWPKSPAFTGTYTVQTSTDLDEWTDVSSVEAGGFVEYAVPAGGGRVFVRLKVTVE